MSDLIDRQAAIDALHTWFKDGFDEDKWWNSTHVLAAIEGLPPAQPEIPDDARDAFMNLVYDELHSDGDNNRANRIIDAADEYVEYSLAKQYAKLGTNLAEVGTDCISRQAALDIFDDYNVAVENGQIEAYSRDRKRLCDLPPAQPEPCEDAVSRAEILRMINCINDHHAITPYKSVGAVTEHLTRIANNLPHVTPKQR